MLGRNSPYNRWLRRLHSSSFWRTTSGNGRWPAPSTEAQTVLQSAFLKVSYVFRRHMPGSWRGRKCCRPMQLPSFSYWTHALTSAVSFRNTSLLQLTAFATLTMQATQRCWHSSRQRWHCRMCRSCHHRHRRRCPARDATCRLRCRFQRLPLRKHGGEPPLAKQARRAWMQGCQRTSLDRRRLEHQPGRTWGVGPTLGTARRCLPPPHV